VTPKVRKEGRKPFNDREVGQILKASVLGPMWFRDRVAVALMLGCGLRLNEARELKLDDIDYEDKIIRVRAETSKGGRGREVRLDPLAATALTVYIKDWRGQPSTDQIFVSRFGTPMTYLSFHHMFARMRERFAKLGIQDFKAHRLRHTYATNYHRSGGSLFDLQREGGWTELSMVRRYTANTPMAELHKKPTPLAWLMNQERKAS
jgi:integrase/recombinase XerD